MSHPSRPRSGGWPSSGRPDDDGWGPSTAVYSGSGARGSSTRGSGNPPHTSEPRNGRAVLPTDTRVAPAIEDENWSPAGPHGRAQQRANRQAERSVRNVPVARGPERGLPWWGALLILLAIAAVGGIIDTLGDNQVRGGFNIGIVVASLVGILVVKRSHMFPIVISPPIVYSAAAVFQLYVRSSGLNDKKVVYDAAANYLVYGFPAIAAATAAVLLVAGVRLIARK